MSVCCAQHLRFDWEGHALCRLQGAEKKDHYVLCDQECSEVAEAKGLSGGAIYLCPLKRVDTTWLAYNVLGLKIGIHSCLLIPNLLLACR
jgi:hypothetical protein